MLTIFIIELVVSAVMFFLAFKRLSNLGSNYLFIKENYHLTENEKAIYAQVTLPYMKRCLAIIIAIVVFNIWFFYMFM
ncbi:MAG: hypothetical protein V4538_02340 [Bacteroidota bacterium]